MSNIISALVLKDESPAGHVNKSDAATSFGAGVKQFFTGTKLGMVLGVARLFVVSSYTTPKTDAFDVFVLQTNSLARVNTGTQSVH